MKLRVHHLFCSALFVGKGYSEAFCRNMSGIVQNLWGESLHGETLHGKAGGDEELIELVIGPDRICLECPNLVKERCRLDDNHVVTKDEQLAKRLGLEINQRYPRLQLLRQTAENMTKEIFETSCHNCEWYLAGLCSYENLAEKYKRYSGQG